jgi:hypothetical protein
MKNSVCPSAPLSEEAVRQRSGNEEGYLFYSYYES